MTWQRSKWRPTNDTRFKRDWTDPLVLALCADLAIPVRAWAKGCPTKQLWTSCVDPQWLLLVAEATHACDARTFVQLAYDFALRVCDPEDFEACAALGLINRWLDGESVTGLELNTSAQTMAHSAELVLPARVLTLGVARATVTNATWAAATVAHGVSLGETAFFASATAWSATCENDLTAGGVWQCIRIRELISAPNIPVDLERAVAAKYLREAE